MPVSLDARRELTRDLAGAAAWAVFIGGGIALGLSLGSLGADVPADSEMLVLAGLIVGLGTLVVRLLMVGWKHRGLWGGSSVPTGASIADGASARVPARAMTVDPEPSASDMPEPTGTAKKPPIKAATKKPAAKKPSAGAATKKPAAKKPSAGAATKKPAAKKPSAKAPAKTPTTKPRKKPSGGSARG